MEDNYYDNIVSEPVAEYNVVYRAASRRNDSSRAITGDELISRVSERLKTLF